MKPGWSGAGLSAGAGLVMSEAPGSHRSYKTYGSYRTHRSYFNKPRILTITSGLSTPSAAISSLSHSRGFFGNPRIDSSSRIELFLNMLLQFRVRKAVAETEYRVQVIDPLQKDQGIVARAQRATG